MKRLGKWLAVVLAALAVLVIAVVVLVKVLVTPERVRQTVLPVAEKHLQRQVAIGDIRISVFSGVRLADLAIAGKEGEETFVAADEVVLSYSFWPLLAGRVVIDEVRLVAPHIRIARHADGTFNFSDLLAARPEAGAPPAAPAGNGGGIDLLVSEVAVTGGDVVFLDYLHDPAAPYRLQVADLELTVRDVALDKPFPYRLSARIGDAPLRAEGRIDPTQPGGSAQLQLEGLDVTAFAPYFGDALPGTLGGAHLSLDLEASGSAAAVTSQGRVALEGVELTLAALPDAPLRQASLGFDYDLRADFAEERLTLTRGRVDFNGLVAEITGEVRDYADEPRLDLTLEVPGLELRKAIAALPRELVAPAAGLDPAGTVEARLHLAGSAGQPQQLLQEGTVRLAKVQASLGPLRPALSGTVALAGGSLRSEDLVLLAGDNRADLDLRAESLLQPPVRASLGLKAETFDLDPLLAAGAPAGEGQPPATEAPAGGEPGPFDLPLRLEVDAAVGRATLKGLAVDDFRLHALLEKNVLTVDRLTGRLAGGSFSDTARVDLGRKGLAYENRLVLDGLQAAPFLGAFQPRLQNLVGGTLDFDGTLAWQGSSLQALRRTLDGKGEALLADGRLGGGALTRGLASLLGIEELGELDVERWVGTYRLDEGKVRIDSLLKAQRVTLAPVGTVGLDGGLDLSLDARLAPELTGRLAAAGKVARYFKDDQGWSRVPIKLGGSFTDPSFAVDTRAAAQQAGQELKQSLEKKVLERLAPEPDQKEGAGEPAQEPAKKLLQDAVKGLFGN